MPPPSLSTTTSSARYRSLHTCTPPPPFPPGARAVRQQRRGTTADACGPGDSRRKPSARCPPNAFIPLGFPARPRAPLSSLRFADFTWHCRRRRRAPCVAAAFHAVQRNCVRARAGCTGSSRSSSSRTARTSLRPSRRSSRPHAPPTTRARAREGTPMKRAEQGRTPLRGRSRGARCYNTVVRPLLSGAPRLHLCASSVRLEGHLSSFAGLGRPCKALTPRDRTLFETESRKPRVQHRQPHQGVTTREIPHNGG